MKSRPRLSRSLFLAAAGWAGIVGVFVASTAVSGAGSSLRTYIWLALPVVVAGLATVWASARPWVAWSLTASFAVLSLLSIASFGLFLLPGLLLMAVGSVFATHNALPKQAITS